MASKSIIRDASSRAVDKFLPEERAMIERLMMRVKECGEGPARKLEFGGRTIIPPQQQQPVTKANLDHADDSWEDSMDRALEEDNGKDNTIDDDENMDGVLRCSTATGPMITGFDSQEENYNMNTYSMEALRSVAESGVILTDPSTGFPSVKHFEALTTAQRFGFLPCDKMPRGQQQQQQQHHITEQFDKTPQFVDALLFLAENLFLIPREEQKETLRHQLRALECELLPSNSIKLPWAGIGFIMPCGEWLPKRVSLLAPKSAFLVLWHWR
jgi:hypothetical protein